MKRWPYLRNSPKPANAKAYLHHASTASIFLHDSVLHLLIVIGVVLAFLADFRWADLPGAVDWHTIITLTGLLILTKGLETSGYFDVLGDD